MMFNPFERLLEKLKSAEAKLEEAFPKVVSSAEKAASTAAKSTAHAGEKAVKGAGGAVVAAEHKFVDLLRDFLRLEAAGGIVLVIAAVTAILIANSPLHYFYNFVLNEIDFRIGFSDYDGTFDFELKKPVLLWVDDGLMAIFFFLVGLEIKRHFVQGELSSRDRALLPAFAAIGGILVPAAIFAFINHGNETYITGWAIPAATDIAFALGVLSLLGSRVPTSVKVLLTAVAIIDDIAAILIIAVFYSHGIHVIPLCFAAAVLLVMFLINRNGVTTRTPYLLLTLVLWVSVLESGVHATIAGVIAAFFVPLKVADGKEAPLLKIEHALHPWVAFCVLPIFAFANAGVTLIGLDFESLVLHPVTLGICFGLFFGKQIGVLLMVFLAHVTRLAPKPDDMNWRHIYGVAILCGVGFTMSLFIGGLAYSDYTLQATVRVGVLMGSILSAVFGYFVMLWSTSEKSDAGEEDVPYTYAHDEKP